MKKYFYFLGLIFIFGCTSKQKKEVVNLPAGTAVQWETKAQIRNFKNNKSNSLTIDIIAVKNSQMRMEISATLGYPVASFVSNQKDIRMAVYTQKKFFFGPNSEEALLAALQFPLDPNIFQNVVFDQPIKGWKCEMGEDGLVSVCKKAINTGDMVVAWPERKDGVKRVIIQGPQFEMQWQFKSQKILSQIKVDAFKLDVPNGYKVVPL